MTLSRTANAVSRRTALAGLGAGGLGLALATTVRQVSAQDAAPDLSSHPMVGAWLVAGPNAPSMTIIAADGTFLDSGPTSGAGPEGVTFSSATIGTWEPFGERGIHFTAVSVQTDANGNFTGTFTIDGHPRASEDGQSFIDDSPETMGTIRDAEHNVVQVLGPAAPNPPRTAVRMGVGAPGFPAGTPPAATPTT
jgi:hypothetical protein